MICKRCGQAVEDGAKFCPYCGAEMENEVVDAVVEEENTPAKNVFAIIGWINGIVALALCWIPFMGLDAIVGIIFSNIGKASKDHSEKARTGAKMNIIALVINIVLTIAFYSLIFGLAATAEY